MMSQIPLNELRNYLYFLVRYIYLYFLVRYIYIYIFRRPRKNSTSGLIQQGYFMARSTFGHEFGFFFRFKRPLAAEHFISCKLRKKVVRSY